MQIVYFGQMNVLIQVVYVLIKLVQIIHHMWVLYLTLIVNHGCLNVHIMPQHVLIRLVTIIMIMYSNTIILIVLIGCQCVLWILVPQAVNQKHVQITLYQLLQLLHVKDGSGIVRLMWVEQPVKTLVHVLHL
jgi:hypothetical protein